MRSFGPSSKVMAKVPARVSNTTVEREGETPSIDITKMVAYH